MVTEAADVMIRATPQQVWDVLVTFDEYHLWNPFIVEAAGIAEPGRRLRLAVRRGGIVRYHAVVTAASPARTLEWAGRLVIPRMFDVRHRFDLQPVVDGTHVTQSVVFRGLLVAWARDLQDDAARSLDDLNAALRDRVEAVA